MTRISDKELIRRVAQSDGMHLPPAFYRNEVERRFGREVSSASVCKALGPYSSRLRLPERTLLKKAKDLLIACEYDKFLAGLMVHRASAR